MRYENTYKIFSLLNPIMQNKTNGKHKTIKQTIFNIKSEMNRFRKNPIITHQHTKKIAVE